MSGLARLESISENFRASHGLGGTTTRPASWDGLSQGTTSARGFAVIVLALRLNRPTQASGLYPGIYPGARIAERTNTWYQKLYSLQHGMVVVPRSWPVGALYLTRNGRTRPCGCRIRQQVGGVDVAPTGAARP